MLVELFAGLAMRLLQNTILTALAFLYLGHALRAQQQLPGVLIDNGTHSLDIMRYFLGNLVDIRVVEGLRIQELDVEDTVNIFVRAENGALGCVDLSWSLHKDQPYFVSIFGSEGTVEIGWRGSRYKLKGESGWTEFGSGYNKVECFKNQLENFRGAIVADMPLVITPEDGIASVCIVEAAYQSMQLQKSQWQTVEYQQDSVD